MLNIGSRRCWPSSGVYWKKKYTLYLIIKLFSITWILYAVYCWVQQWKNINREDSKIGTKIIKGKGVDIWDSLQMERQGLKADVTQVSITRKNMDGENIISVANPRTLGERHHLKLLSFTFKTESKLKNSFIKYSIRSGEGRGEKKEYKENT